MKVALSRDAQADLRAIARWIAKDNPARALSFPAELREKCMGLSRYPRRFPVVVRLGEHDIRKRVHRDYMIFYRVLGTQIEVLQIVHASMDWAVKLAPPE